MDFDFIVVRLGKDSVEDIKKLDSTSDEGFQPYTLEFTCSQVEKSIDVGYYALIYLGSDNNKGTPTAWKQGARALGKVEKKIGGEEFNSPCQLSINVFSVFRESLDQLSFLDKSPTLYKHFAKYPVIGVKTSRNNAVQKVNEGERENTSALLTSIKLIYEKFESELLEFAPELLNLLDFEADTDPNSMATIGTNNTSTTNNEIKGTNTIYYGAPGTGKSFAINQSIVADRTFKTVFHAESMSSDFVGCIKPVLHNAENGGAPILTYEYVPGPLIQCLVSALNDPYNHYWLVIEEINRAPAAAVFGEIFQLLDRDNSGRSSYEINFPDSLCHNFVNSNIHKPITRLFIPSNLSIIASMNSGDQGVLPLDTAFKRRWRFRYMPIDFERGCAVGTLKITLEDDTTQIVSWKDFACCVNSILSETGIPEDRHLGPFFFSEEELADSENALTGKLFMYLWDDVLRHGMRHRLFLKSITTYGELVRHHTSTKQLFNEIFISLVKARNP